MPNNNNANYTRSTNKNKFNKLVTGNSYFNWPISVGSQLLIMKFMIMINHHSGQSIYSYQPIMNKVLSLLEMQTPYSYCRLSHSFFSLLILIPLSH